MKTCENCVFCLLMDDGYSNYTVEGTTASCLHNANPHLPSDRFYGKAPELQYAEHCEFFVEGDPIHVDVDRDRETKEGGLTAYTDNVEAQALLILEGVK